MKLSHLTIFFIIIILPFSIIARNNMNDYFLTLKDQVRLNTVIDSATQDALDTLIDLNEEFQMLYSNQRIDITQSLAEESVRSFFKTLAINNNMPYIAEKTESYFSVYVPAIVIVAYDGFFIYSVDESVTGGYGYQMSPKIPYAYADPETGAIINFTLGNYIKIYTNGKYYQGELTDDYYEDSFERYSGDYIAAFGNEDDAFENIADLTNDMSIILAALKRKQDVTPGAKYVPSFLIAHSGDSPETTDIPLRQDFGKDNSVGSDFHKIRRDTIINVIKQTLQQEINSHETYAKIMGSTYDFFLPEIPGDDWTNSINDISVMSFIQGMPIGTRSYFNNYALGASRIVQTDYIYGTQEETLSNGDKVKHYHSSDCDFIQVFFHPELAAGGHSPTGQLSVDNLFVSREQAATNGYYPCMHCSP